LQVKLGYDVLQEQERILSTKDAELDSVRTELKKQVKKQKNKDRFLSIKFTEWETTASICYCMFLIPPDVGMKIHSVVRC
jgi:hypothetical protein